MVKGRVQNSINNVKSGFITQVINKLMMFLVRTVFINCLNSEYLGIHGLFTNILTILSFAELGIGTAIIFNMYKPVAKDDRQKIKSLMDLYNKCYRIIGIVIFFLGLLVIPFMKYLVKDISNINENVILIYILYLINTSISYFFTYKKSIIIAYQKQSIINNIDSVFFVVKSAFEILFLLLTKNFIIYLLIQIVGTFIENLIISIKSDQLFPYLNQKSNVNLSKKEKKGIFDNVKALIVFQFGLIIMNGTDNILLATLINITAVGLCSNYTMIVNAIKSILSVSLSGVVASVGNLNAVGTRQQKEDIFYQLTFIYYIIYSFCAVALIVLLNPFIKIWLGEKYLLGMSVSVALALNFFVDGLRQPGFMYRTTLGMFQKSKIIPYIGAITNIVLSIILCRYFGIAGIFYATIISQLVSYSWIDPFLIHKFEFDSSFKKYLKKYIIYIITFVLVLSISLFVSNLLKTNLYVEFLYKIIVAIIIPNFINIFLFYNCKEFKLIKKKINFKK